MWKVTREKATRIILHILAWAVILGLPIYSAIRFRMGTNFLVTYYTFASINALIFYTNYLFLVPVLFFQSKRYRYYLSILALVFFFYFISDFANKQIFSYISKKGNSDQVNGPPVGLQIDRQQQMPRPPLRMRPRIIIAMPNAQIIGYMSSSLLMVFLSLGLRVLERQSKFEKMQEEMERAKLNAELAFLKNQVSPHFFFNTLNNIYSLIGKSADDSQKAVLQLSKLMRYLLYESDHGNTRLSNEIDFMKNYLDLMKLRMNEKVSLSVDLPENYVDISIPPLLFIAFIENAFKHGITNRGRSFINISLHHSEASLDFRCTNSIAENSQKDKEPGIGLENVRKRLNLLFPGKHKLVISNENREFDVLLKIFLT